MTNSKVTCSTVNALYYLKCNLCKIETHIENMGFKTRMSNHISESRTGTSSCTFSRHIYQCDIKNGNFIEPFEINFMLRSNDAVKFKYLEKHFQNKGYDLLNNPLRNSYLNIVFYQKKYYLEALM